MSPLARGWVPDAPTLGPQGRERSQAPIQVFEPESCPSPSQAAEGLAPRWAGHRCGSAEGLVRMRAAGVRAAAALPSCPAVLGPVALYCTVLNRCCLYSCLKVLSGVPEVSQGG